MSFVTHSEVVAWYGVSRAKDRLSFCTIFLFTSICENTHGNGKASNDYFKTLVPV